MCAHVKTNLIYPINYSRSIEAKEIKGTDSSTNSIKRTGVQYFPQLEIIERLWKLLIFKNGAQEKKTLSLTTGKGAQEKKMLSLTTGKGIAAKFCTQGCLKRTWLTSEGIFVRFLAVLRGERAHCKNNGRGFFNRERILPVTHRSHLYMYMNYGT